MDRYDEIDDLLNNADGMPLERLLKSKADDQIIVVVGDGSDSRYTTIEALAENAGYEVGELIKLIRENCPQALGTVASRRAMLDMDRGYR